MQATYGVSLLMKLRTEFILEILSINQTSTKVAPSSPATLLVSRDTSIHKIVLEIPAQSPQLVGKWRRRFQKTTAVGVGWQ